MGYVDNNPINRTDPTGLCGPFGDGGCPGGSLVPDEISDAVGTAGNKIKGAGQTVARCVGDAVTCGENIEKAFMPVVAAGFTVAVAGAGVLACTGAAISVVGAPVCGLLAATAIPAFVGGLYVTYQLAQDLWFGEGHDKAYHPLGGEHEEEGALNCDSGGLW